MSPARRRQQGLRMGSRRSRVYALLTERHSSRRARWLAYYFDFLVFLSMLALCIQTVPLWRTRLFVADFIVETVVSVQFLLRLVTKLFTCPRVRRHVASWDFCLDVLSVAPWVVELGLFLVKRHGSWQVHLRLLRMLRFGRLLQCGWASPKDMHLFTRALRRSRSAFQFLAGYGLAGLLCFAWALWVAETYPCRLEHHALVSRRDGSLCPMQNVFDALWLCLCTLATVGYGDYVPHTALGKLITSVMMVLGYVCLALPVAIFGANLTELYVEARLQRRSHGPLWVTRSANGERKKPPEEKP